MRVWLLRVKIKAWKERPKTGNKGFENIIYNITQTNGFEEKKYIYIKNIMAYGNVARLEMYE